MNTTPILLNIISLTAVSFGLLICFFGYRVFRFLLIVAGFLIGASLSVALVFALTQESILALNKGSDFWIIIIAGIVGGLGLAIIFLVLYSAGVFLLGALFGIALFSGGTALTDINTEPFLYLIPALVGGVLALFLQKFMVVLITSFTGAGISTIGVIYLINKNFNPLDPYFINNMSDIETYRVVLSWFALFILGVITQFFIFPKKTEISEKLEIQPENKVEKRRKSILK